MSPDNINSWNRLEENKLPHIKVLYSKLRGYNGKKSDYDHSQNVWNIFKIQNFCQYMGLSLKTDVLLLADVYESFRKVCLKIYNLECLTFYTAEV